MMKYKYPKDVPTLFLVFTILQLLMILLLSLIYLEIHRIRTISIPSLVAPPPMMIPPHRQQQQATINYYRTLPHSAFCTRTTPLSVSGSTTSTT